MNPMKWRINRSWREKVESGLPPGNLIHETMTMSEAGPTLCLPDAEKSCFACCPPIRPAGYEHFQHQNTIKRTLRENTLAFAKNREGVFPITGFSCWALGYLDQRYRLVGCLLHPAQNGGEDLRYRIDYEEKCRRESCPEATVFSELGIHERIFWLQLADGLDSFAYSSKRINPLFVMMGWGADLLRLIALHEHGRTFRKGSFFQTYPFFTTRLNPRANAYLLTRIVKRDNIHLLKTESFCSRFEAFSLALSERVRETSACGARDPYTHRLELDRSFLNFLRLSADISTIDHERARNLKVVVDAAIQRFWPSYGRMGDIAAF
jgi:hypothetical protein